MRSSRSMALACLGPLALVVGTAAGAVRVVLRVGAARMGRRTRGGIAAADGQIANLDLTGFMPAEDVLVHPVLVSVVDTIHVRKRRRRSALSSYFAGWGCVNVP